MSFNMSFGADYEFYAISNFNFAGMKAYGASLGILQTLKRSNILCG